MRRTSSATRDRLETTGIFAQRQTTRQVDLGQAFDYWRSTASARVDASHTEDLGSFAADRLLAVSPTAR